MLLPHDSISAAISALGIDPGQITGNPEVIGVHGSVCDSSAVEQRSTPKVVRKSCWGRSAAYHRQDSSRATGGPEVDRIREGLPTIHPRSSVVSQFEIAGTIVGPVGAPFV
jgi:hypothetical protein